MKRKAAQVSKDALAGGLIDSLDGEVDPDAETAWDAEIARRLQEIDDRKVSLVSWPEVRRRLYGV